MIGTIVAAAIAAAALISAVPAPASAHPLGNFTINHYSAIRVSSDAVLIDHVTDFAEIPTFQERRAMDLDADGTVADNEVAEYQRSSCAGLADALDLRRDGRRLDLAVIETGLGFRDGQAALTTRLVCVYRAELAPSLEAATTFTIAESSYSERRGWREIVVDGDGVSIIGSDVPAEGVSARLTDYPSGLLATPVERSNATWTARPGGAALPAFDVPDAAPVTTSSPVEPPLPAARPLPDAPTVELPPAAVPGGVSELGGDLGAIFQARDLTIPVVLLSLFLAAGLGAVHALSPGHGKTVMAAYLVGTRGSMRHAVGLGLTVTISHTLGVLALGVLSLSAATVIAPERLYPILGVISGAIVLGIGVYLIAGRIREWSRERAETRAHEEAHRIGTDHEHDHSDDGAHAHDHVAGHDAHDDDAHDDGWHAHGGMRHTHLPPRGSSLSWRGLFALGLAGGMVPSVSALILLLGSISLGRPAYGIVLTIAFGVGMAAVLVGVGLSLVYARGLIERFSSRSTGQRLGRLLPAATALVVLAAGIVITGQALLSV